MPVSLTLFLYQVELGNVFCEQKPVDYHQYKHIRCPPGFDSVMVRTLSSPD